MSNNKLEKQKEGCDSKCRMHCLPVVVVTDSGVVDGVVVLLDKGSPWVMVVLVVCPAMHRVSSLPVRCCCQRGKKCRCLSMIRQTPSPSLLSHRAAPCPHIPTTVLPGCSLSGHSERDSDCQCLQYWIISRVISLRPF